MIAIRNISSYLILALVFQAIQPAFGQNPVVLAIRQMKTSGDTVWTDLIADHFKNIVSFQFSVGDLQANARFLAIENMEPALDLLPSDYSGQSPNTSLRVSWTYPNLNGLSLPTAHRLFTIKWLKNNNTTVCIGFPPKESLTVAFQYSRQLPNTTITFSSCDNIVVGHFNVFYDQNKDCLYTIGEPILDDYELADLHKNQTTYFRNLYSFFQDTSKLGIHNYTAAVPNSLWSFCKNSQQVIIDSTTQSFYVDFPLQALKACPKMGVEISAPVVKRCVDYAYQVNYRNYGTAKAQNVNIRIKLDPFTRFVKSSIPFTTYIHPYVFFNIGEVGIFSKGTFSVTVQVDCQTAVEGQTHCVEAIIYPNDPWDVSPNWNKAKVQVDGKCEGGKVKFEILNGGVGPMMEPTQFWIVEEDLMPGLKRDVKLNPGEKLQLDLDANGKTYRLSVDQVSNFPGRSYPTIAVEGCGLNGFGDFSRGYVTQFPEDEEDDFKAIDCQASQADANHRNKLAIPSGAQAQHFIEPGRRIEYKIHFQNEGNDTAYRIVIRDTLSEVLDLSTLVLTNASHPFTYGVENRVLEIRFDPIRLPFKNVNEIASHGFVVFSIVALTDIIDNYRLTNQAEVIFDYGATAKTNTVYHTLKKDFLITSIYNPKDPDGEFPPIKFYPNPSDGAVILERGNCSEEETLYVYNMTGELFERKKLSVGEEKIRLAYISKPGLYYLIIKRGDTLCYYGSITILK